MIHGTTCNGLLSRRGIVVALCCVWLWLFLMVPCEALSLSADRVLATVNNEIITFSDYRKFAAKLDQPETTDAVNERILKNLIEEKIIQQHARKAGIDASENEVEKTLLEFQTQNNISREELIRSLSEEGMSLDDYKKMLKENIISLKTIDREVNAKVFVTEAETAAYYQRNKKLFLDKPEKMEVKAILMRLSDSPSVTEVTDLKLKALKVYGQIRSGEPFDRMVSLYSEPGLKSRNGLLGEFEKGVLISQLDRKLSTMKEQEVSEPIWTKEGVYLLFLTKRKDETYIPLDAVRQQIHEKLYHIKKEDKFNEWMKSLWEKSSIKIK